MAEAKTKEQQATGGSGKGMKIVVGVMAVLLMAAVGAVSYLLGHRSAPVAASAESTAGHAEAPAEAKSAEPLYLALDPPFVVNFQSDSATRFLQVGVQLMAHDQKALDAAKASEPAVRNALVMLFSSQDAKTLVSRDGKEKLRTDALDEIRKIVAERSKSVTLDAVYFTSFVMQ
ncbi:MAG TPA: flagellar basal body-associated FliL family protein [Rhodanobacteraceae bacterium]|nr:flagellar basal body-associated FliL family protein [Rhodanobacteraceae bacterium]